jgi:O-antigen ligase
MEKPFRKFLRKALEYSFYLFVFLLPWQTKIILRPAATNFTAISLYLSQLLLLLILIGFFIYQLCRRQLDEPISKLWWFLAGLELGVFLSFFAAPDQVLAFYYYVVILEGIGLFYLVREGLAFYGYEDAILDRTKVIYSLFASLFLQALLGIYQFLNQTTVVFKYLGLAAHNPSDAGTAVVETLSGRWLRAYGGLDHPNILGGVLAIALIMVAYLLAKEKMIRSKQEAMEAILLFIFYFVALFSLFFTFSRAAWLALAIGLVYLAVVIIRQHNRWAIDRFFVLIFFSLIMIFIAGYPYRDLVATRASDDTRLEQKSLTDRQVYLGQSASLIKNNWLGVGPGNYTVALERQDKIKKNIWEYQPVHNVFLLLWSESGIFSLLCFLGFLWLLKKNGQWELSGPLLATLIILMLCDHWLFSSPFGLLFLFWLLGLM